MRERGLLFGGFLLFLSAGLLIRGLSGFSGKTLEQAKPERPKFYALRVVFEKNVQNPKDSLGEPDGRYAEILPGGQIILFMENKLYPFPIIGSWGEGFAQPDSGSIVGKGEGNFSLEGWFPVQDKLDKQNYGWITLVLSATGFSFWPSYDMGVDMIRIVNIGTKSLFVDAVIGYFKEAERR